MKRAFSLILALIMVLCLAPDALAATRCEHNWVFQNVDYTTCTGPAYYVYVCSKCGESNVEQRPGPGHDYRRQGEDDATCTQNGSVSYVCSNCGDSYSETVPALGHNWGSWQQAQAPSCTQNGTETRACTRCGATESRTVSGYGGHDYGDWQEASPGDCVTLALRVRVCRRCGAEDYTYWGYGPHNWGEWETVQAPTCTAPGLRRRVCKLDAAHKEEEAIPADPAAHNFCEWEEVYAPTPDRPGLEQRVCSNDPSHVETQEVAYASPDAPLPPPDGGEPDEGLEPNLRLSAESPKGAFQEGETFEVVLTLTNTGGVALERESAEGPDRDQSGLPLLDLPQTLQPQETWSRTATVTVTKEDIDESLTAPPTVDGNNYMSRTWKVSYKYMGDPAAPVPVSDSATISAVLGNHEPQELEAGLKISVYQTSPQKEYYTKGEQIFFDVTLQNIGSVDLYACVLTITNLGPAYIDIGFIAAGESETVPWDVTVNLDHVVDGEVALLFDAEAQVVPGILESGDIVHGQTDGVVHAEQLEFHFPVMDGTPLPDVYQLELTVNQTSPEQAEYMLTDKAYFDVTLTNHSEKTLNSLEIEYGEESIGFHSPLYVGDMGPGESRTETYEYIATVPDLDFCDAFGSMSLIWKAHGFDDQQAPVFSNIVTREVVVGTNKPAPAPKITITQVAPGSSMGAQEGDWVEAAITVKNTGDTPWQFENLCLYLTGYAGEEYDYADFTSQHGITYAPGESFYGVLRIRVTAQDAAGQNVFRDLFACCVCDGQVYSSNVGSVAIPLDSLPPSPPNDPPYIQVDEPDIDVTAVCLDAEPFYLDDAGQTGPISYYVSIRCTGHTPFTVNMLRITTAAGVREEPIGPFTLYYGDSTPTIPVTNDFSEAEVDGEGKVHIAFFTLGYSNGQAFGSVEPELSHLVDKNVPPWIPPTETNVTVNKYEVSTRPTAMGYRLNDTVAYEVWVFNDSDIPIPQVDIYDPLFGEGVVASVSDLQPYTYGHDSLYYTVVQDDVTRKEINNTVTVKWTDPETGVGLERISNTVTVPVTNETPEDMAGVYITTTFEKEPANGSYYVTGEVVPVKVEWGNPHTDSTLMMVAVYDYLAEKCGAAPGGYVGGGENGTFIFNYTVDEIDTKVNKFVYDYAEISAWREFGGMGYSLWDMDTESRPADEDPPAPNVYVDGLKVEKKEVSHPLNHEYYTEGEIIEYEITLTNIGNVDLTDVQVGDSLSDTLNGVFASMEIFHAGEERKYPFTWKVTAEDVKNAKVVNYGLGYYTYGGIVDIPVVSEPVVSPTGPQPGPVPGPDGKPIDPVTPTGHIETPVIPEGRDEDVCVLTLKAKGEGMADYEQHLCSKHRELYEKAVSQADSLAGEEAKAQVWRKAAEEWKAALDEMYQEILQASSGSARATVMAERAAFYAYVDSFRALMLQRAPREPAKAERAAADMLMGQCAEMCYVTHFAPKDRPDSLISGQYQAIAVSASGQYGRCALSQQTLDNGDLLLREILCGDHTKLDFNAMAALKGAKSRAMIADAFFRARRGWQNELNRIATAQYKAAAKESRPVVSACRTLFDKLLTQREALYAFLYPANPETVAEVMYRTVMRDVILHCK